ncbi:MAG: polysaccharide deacetylase [Lachnospiraceae bacterium]|nr:polysaccharide deacetylase [Lachnospiraceae bacterium]
MTVKMDAQPDMRRKRVQMLKRLIILSLMTAILIPVVLCVILFLKVGSLEKQLNRIEEMVVLALQQSETPTQDGVSPADTESSSADGEKNDGEQVQVGETENEVPAAQPEDVLPTDENTEPVRRVYLTFDDGPSSNTADILDILAAYDVKATFFVTGKEGEWAEAAYQRIVEEGHTLGMHSYTHKYDEIYASVDAFSTDFYKLQNYLFDVTGVRSEYYRFPGGSSNRVSDVSVRELIAFLNEEGIVYFDWNVSSQDATGVQYTAQELVANCMAGIEKHETVIILLHDAAGKGTTVEALPMLIEKIQAMENTELLPITDDTVPVQHIKIAQEETED